MKNKEQIIDLLQGFWKNELHNISFNISKNMVLDIQGFNGISKCFYNVDRVKEQYWCLSIEDFNWDRCLFTVNETTLSVWDISSNKSEEKNFTNFQKIS
ncbi:MAG: hypothetical protein WC716_02365 [Chitinophagaceae bacterium]|jgi:hypothetical protein